VFKKKTLFIVGAGGSAEFGLPIGEKLKTKISTRLAFETQEFTGRISAGDTVIGECLRNLAHNEAKEGQTPINYLLKARFISQGLPHGPSIDNFLHFHSSDAAVVKIGKIAIARSILEAEAESDLRIEEGSNEEVDLSRSVDAWLNKFCMMAIEGHTKEELQDIFHNVRIITFNYDRCIEHYVSRHLERYVGMERTEAQQIANGLRVVHVYGRPGPLPWETNRNNGIPFGHRASPAQLLQLAEQIKTFTEGVHEDSGQELITETMNWSDRIVIMGFSYGDINLNLLLRGIQPRPRIIIAGTAGISPENREIYERAILNGMGGAGLNKPNFSSPTTYCARLLSDHEALLKS
jgi:hypothetical protein